MEPERVRGIVLQATPVGEYDRRLVLLTKEYGKIAAFAKGARRPHCALVACSQPFSFGTFHIYRGRTSNSINGADISNYFEELKKDMTGTCYGLYFCEMSDYFTRENSDATDILNLLYITLRALEKKIVPPDLIRQIFELKMLTLNGEAPQVFECVKCGEKEDKGTRFSFHHDGLLCAKCESEFGHNTDQQLSEAALYTLQYIIASPLKELYGFNVTPKVLTEVKQFMKNYKGKHLTYKFNSEEYLEGFL
ncbi:MAG: DNA repair protein RecO [Lachnospiraceae bacterium]|nr:DNA repair protein RecO [Lachnospiraceae bacterium]